MSGPFLIHATTVALDGSGILLRGPPGSGKSDLALRLIDDGAALVADDQTLLWRAGERVVAGAPATIAGLLEIRGIGILRLEAVAEAPLLLIADLVLASDVERLPERRFETLLGCSLPVVGLAPFEPSTPAKLRFLRRALAAGAPPDIIGV